MSSWRDRALAKRSGQRGARAIKLTKEIKDNPADLRNEKGSDNNDDDSSTSEQQSQQPRQQQQQQQQKSGGKEQVSRSKSSRKAAAKVQQQTCTPNKLKATAPEVDWAAQREKNAANKRNWALGRAIEARAPPLPSSSARAERDEDWASNLTVSGPMELQMEYEVFGQYQRGPDENGKPSFLFGAEDGPAASVGYEETEDGGTWFIRDAHGGEVFMAESDVELPPTDGWLMCPYGDKQVQVVVEVA